MIACSTICYTHGKLLGMEQAGRVINAQLQGQPMRGAPPVPGVDTIRALAQLSPLDPVDVNISTGGASLAKERCRQLDWAIKGKGDFWISVDDDCTASLGTLVSFLAALNVDTPRCVSVPMIKRASGAFEKPELNIWPQGGTPNGKLMAIEWSGFGLVGVNRPALQVISELTRTCSFLDDDGETRPAIFHEIRERLPGSAESFWYSEDISFWKRLPASIERWALIEGESDHAGVTLDLSAALGTP
jgi:hypothetical protein